MLTLIEWTEKNLEPFKEIFKNESAYQIYDVIRELRSDTLAYEHRETEIEFLLDTIQIAHQDIEILFDDIISKIKRIYPSAHSFTLRNLDTIYYYRYETLEEQGDRRVEEYNAYVKTISDRENALTLLQDEKKRLEDLLKNRDLIAESLKEVDKKIELILTN